MSKHQRLDFPPPPGPPQGYIFEEVVEEIVVDSREGRFEERLAFESYGEIDDAGFLEEIEDIETWFGDVTNEPPSPAKPKAVAPPTSRVSRLPAVSVIVAARNQGKYLRACLHSAMAQTEPASEVIYVDDGSEDESLAVAREFEPFGLKVLALPHRGVVKARNQGASASSGETLLFVDGDNLLSPDFLSLHRRALTGGARFSYGPLRHFGARGGRLVPPEFSRSRLWTDNYIDTCSMVRRTWFEAAGGWRENPSKTFWDWDLWLRVSRFGPGVRVPSDLHYRHHEANWSLTHEGRPEADLDAMFGQVRRAAARLAVVSVLGGRLPRLFPAWLDALAESLRGWEGERPELVVMDDSPEGFWSLARPCLDTLEAAFGNLKVIRIHRGLSAVDRRPDRHATSRFLTAAYQRANEETRADVLWYVEDDILVPPNAAEVLSRSLLDGEHPRAAVGGLYRSRHEPCFVVSRFEDGQVRHVTEVPSEPGPCDLTGTGCLMVFRSLVEPRFQPDWPVPGTRYVVPAHDWAFSWDLRESGRPVRIEPEVLCRHYVSETEWV